MTERTTHVMAGVISLLVIAGSVYAGVKITAGGALRPVYQLNATFAAAGQGLMSQSDVKIHGVNVGRVRSVRLRDGRALVRMDIDKGERVPEGAKATIRAKTLFGEKFVDIDPGGAEGTGPFLADEGVIRDTLGAYELERILADLYPILRAVRPEELATVLGTLADAAEGQGPAVNRQIANFAALADLQARHDEDLRRFLDDLALLSEELADKADELVGAAQHLNEVLPTLSQRGDKVTQTLDQLGRLAGDLADVLDANESFFVKANTVGTQAIQLLYDKRDLVIPLVDGLRTFLQVLAEVGHVKSVDGGTLAAVKYIVGEECPNGRLEPCGENAGTAPGAPGARGPQATARTPRAGRLGPGGGAGPVPTLPAPPRLVEPTTGTAAVRDLLEGLLR